MSATNTSMHTCVSDTPLWRHRATGSGQTIAVSVQATALPGDGPSGYLDPDAKYCDGFSDAAGFLHFDVRCEEGNLVAYCIVNVSDLSLEVAGIDVASSHRGMKIAQSLMDLAESITGLHWAWIEGEWISQFD